MRDSTAACDGILADAMIGVDYFNNLSRIDAKGAVVCSALPLAKGINIADHAVLFFRNPGAAPAWWSARSWPGATGQPVIGGMLALRKADGISMARWASRLELRWFDLSAAPGMCPMARWWWSSTANAA